MCIVRNYWHYDCSAVGIVNCVKVLRQWKKAIDVILEVLHIFVKVIPTQKIIGR
jgi:hypothetical protein